MRAFRYTPEIIEHDVIQYNNYGTALFMTQSHGRKEAAVGALRLGAQDETIKRMRWQTTGNVAEAGDPGTLQRHVHTDLSALQPLSCQSTPALDGIFACDIPYNRALVRSTGHRTVAGQTSLILTTEPSKWLFVTHFCWVRPL